MNFDELDRFGGIGCMILGLVVSGVVVVMFLFMR